MQSTSIKPGILKKNLQTNYINRRELTTSSSVRVHSHHPSIIKTNRKYSEIDLDKEIVQNLELWDHTKNNNCFQRSDGIRSDLERKIKNQEVVTQCKLSRKEIDKDKLTVMTDKEKYKFLQNYEEECFENYRNVKEELVKIINSRDDLRKIIIETMEEKNTYCKELDLLEKSPKMITRNFVDPRLKQQDLAHYLFSLQSIKQNTSNEKSELLQHIEMLEIDIKSKNREMGQIEGKLEEARKRLKSIKNNIIAYYIEILKDGTDTRGEGLYCIVKQLVTYGMQVKPLMFPAFFDEISIDTILKIAEKSLEIDEIYEKMISTNNIKGITSIRQNSIQSRLSKLKKTLRTRKLTGKEIENKRQSLLVHNTEEDIFDHYNSESIKHEQKIQSIKKEILEIQIAEIKRLTKECFRSGKNIKHIASFIVGRDNIEKFMIYSHKEIKELQISKEKTKTFNFCSRLLPQPKSVIV